MQTRLAPWLFRAIASNEEGSELVREFQGLKRGALIATALSLMLPFAGLALWQRFGFKSGAFTLGTNAMALVLSNEANKKRKAIKPMQELLSDEKHLKQQAQRQELVEKYNPDLIKPPVVNGIGGQIQRALKACKIDTWVPDVVDACAFYRVKLNLVNASIEDVDNRTVLQKMQTMLRSEIPLTVVEDASCDCAIEVAKPDSERRFVKLEKYLIDGFHPVGTPLTWPAGIDANNKLVTVKISDSNYVHPLVCGTTGSGKSELLLSWVRWLTQWQPSDVQIVLVDPKQVTFGQLEPTERVNNVAAQMGVSRQQAERLFPEDARADELSERIAPWLPYGVISDPKEAIKIYQLMCEEMRRRYAAFREWGAKNAAEYNAKMRRMGLPTMPAFVIITDEYYMQVSDDKNKKATEAALKDLGAMARACDVIVVISTQRPDYKTIDLGIRDNLVWRYALRCQGNSGAIGLGLTEETDQANPTRGLAGKGDAYCWYDGRLVRVQALLWDGSLPGVPTVFPEDVPDPDAVGNRESAPATTATATATKPATKKASSKSAAAPVVADPWSEDGESESKPAAVATADASRTVYEAYREAREAGMSVNQFFEQVLRKRDYTLEYKLKFFEQIAPGLEEWILELHRGDESGNSLLPFQIVSRIFDVKYPPNGKNEKLFGLYAGIVQRVIERGNG